jgi:transcriptional regulator with XRE-family HTH domain
MTDEGSGQHDFQAVFDWRGALRAHRLRLRLSQPEVARRSGLSVSAIKAYESGRRHPTREALDAILDAMGLAHDEGNPIRAGAGFAIDWSGVLHRRYISDFEDLARQADASPWPVFITNQGSYIRHWNKAFEVVLDVDVRREYPDPATRSILGGSTISRFIRCIESYEETMSFFIGLIKGDPRREQNLERPAPWLQDIVSRLVQGDPADLRRLIDIWQRAEPIPHKIRHQYNIVWRYRGGDPLMRFIGRHTVCDIWNELNWQEWVPADADTWAALEVILATSGDAIHKG